MRVLRAMFLVAILAFAGIVQARDIQWCPYFSPGWNLVGNPTNTQFNVRTNFVGLSDKIVSVWKWSGPQSGIWEFYSPRLAETSIQKYAADKGLGVLIQVNPGEGFWVLATDYYSMPCITAQADETLEFNLSFGAIQQGWSLVALSSNMQVSEIARVANQSPPTPGGGVTSALNPKMQIISMWGWNSDKGKWYFYSPMIDTVYGPTAAREYTERKGYELFPEWYYPVGNGLWMNIVDPNTDACVLVGCGGKG